MTLSEIESILEELALRHNNLSTELLTTLLLSAGWDDKNIKEAVTLYKQKDYRKQVVLPEQQKEKVITQIPANLPKTETKAEITFYQPDGTEEKELRGLALEVTEKRDAQQKRGEDLVFKVDATLPEIPAIIPSEEKNDEKIVIPEVKEQEVAAEKELKEEILPNDLLKDHVTTEDSQNLLEKDTNNNVSIPLKITEKVKEPESLLLEKKDNKERKVTKENEIPSDLPLLPFESSPYVWSFSRYKDVFHKEGVEDKKIPEMVPEKKEVFPSIAKPQSTSFVKENDDEEIVIEKIPLNREDESLVFLAGVMLLVIILILGYMYSNGRL